jgi:hypothetical protein
VEKARDWMNTPLRPYCYGSFDGRSNSSLSGKGLSRVECVSVSEHLSTCEQCRGQVTLSPEFERLASHGITALTGLTRERKLSDFPFRQSTGTKRLATDMRNYLCPSVLADGHQSESIEPPRWERSGSLRRRVFAARIWSIATWATVAAAAALVAVFWISRAPEEGGKLVTIRDFDKELSVEAHGLIGTDLSGLTESQQLKMNSPKW